MSGDINKQAKKEVMKDIILKLHSGLSVKEAKERFEKEVGNITSVEIADIEQTLINEGLSPEEIKKFCNVHALIFQSALEKAASEETFPSHPVYLFKLENREIEKLINTIKEIVESSDSTELSSLKERLTELLLKLRGVVTHYERKEQLLFPYLEKQGFMGPSKVMWGKDNEIRELLKTALQELEGIGKREEFDGYADKTMNPLLEEIEGMIFKEENILFPTALEKLGATDWVEILGESESIGYVFIEKPAETEILVRNLKTALLEEPVILDGAIALPSGTIRLNEVIPLFNTLPFDLTFVDTEDKVTYFTEGKDRIFSRTRSTMGRKVQNCHPPQSVDVVEKILGMFKEGKKNFFDFWFNYRGMDVYVRYFAVRDRDGQYLGTLEVSQNITGIKKLEGERRLADERN